MYISSGETPFLRFPCSLFAAIEHARSGLMVMAVMLLVVFMKFNNLIPQVNTQNKRPRDNDTENEVDCKIRHGVTSQLKVWLRNLAPILNISLFEP